MKTKLVYSIAATLAIAGMVAFGGCSSAATDSTTALPTVEGTFIDSEVQGLTYKGFFGSEGITDEFGHYNFATGEYVEFKLGRVGLGRLRGKTSPVSPLDFYNGTKTIDSPEIVNILRVLQSLDKDGNPENGINITPDAVAAFEAALEAAGVDPATADLATMSDSELDDLLVKAVRATVTTTDGVVSGEEAKAHFTMTMFGPQPPISKITGSLACDLDARDELSISTDAKDFNASQTLHRKVSSKSTEDVNRENGTSHNTLKRLSVVVDERTSDGSLTLSEDNVTLSGVQVHPLAVAYLQQIKGDYEMGDGSADIGDPDQVDGVFFAISLDNGQSWRNSTISDSTEKSSMKVLWSMDVNADKIKYPGHAQKVEMAVEGNNIVVAWHDKYCPSGNPFDLERSEDNASYPTDYFGVNGTQKSIDYTEAQDGSRVEMIAPNGKYVYEVPFSCVWTARGILNPADGNVTWHAPMQLTTGTRDSNHIWIEGSDAGFAMTWQEDTEGLRSGKGEGPGDGWSGATTNHGTDVWYSSLKMEDFNASTVDENSTKPKSVNNFHYPVRITDNQSCTLDSTLPYCQDMCEAYDYNTTTTQNNAENNISRCYSYDVDMLTNTQVILDGDTGASRPALELLKTTDGETIVVFGYEETKGLSESTPGEGDQDQGDSETIIALEGKSVYFESFKFDAIDAFDETNASTTFLDVEMPLVSAGNIVNVKVPDMNTSEMIYENARRVVIGTQVDSCDADKHTFAFMYKQSFDTQGASSDMFVRANGGFTYDSFVAINDQTLGDLNVTNISAQEPIVVDLITDYNVSWDSSNLNDNTYENLTDNTFSPRIFLRGNDIYTGFEYTPNDVKTQVGNMPSNFHTHIYADGAWIGPVNVTKVLKGSVNTVDARFFSTPKGAATGLASDQSNPNVLFVTWGELDLIVAGDQSSGKTESNLYYKRALYTDADGWVWDEEAQKLATKEGTVIEEKEVQSLATPDGKTIFNLWIQEEEDYNQTDPDSGLDTWFGLVDYNVSNIVE